MALKANFVKDVAAHCTDLLRAAGYTFQTTDDRDAIRIYTSVWHRRIPSRPRTIHKALYIVPPHLTAGEQQLLLKVAAGGDLWPHQSRKIVDITAEDGMLNDYGIQHFHLGTTPDHHQPQLIQGTKELLFAVVKDDDFYALGIFDHAAWSKQVLLDIIHRNWPHLIAPYAAKNVLGPGRDHTEAEAANLRRKDINVLHKRSDGTVHWSPGGGIAMGGNSVEASRLADRLEIQAKNLQDFILRNLWNLRNLEREVPSDMLVRLQWRGDKAFVVTVPAAFEQDVSDQLTIPPL